MANRGGLHPPGKSAAPSEASAARAFIWRGAAQADVGR